ncbi:MAG: hypothetical protein Q8S19_03095 [Bacillota bacterium]|nr:hypothetical protein [Bacillota bacterium]
MRLEFKYYIPIDLGARLMELCAKHGTLDGYGTDNKGYTIVSIYKNVWAEEKLSGKLRLRKYVSLARTSFFLEEKVRIGSCIEKNRIPLTERQYIDLIATEQKESLQKLVNLSDLPYFSFAAHGGSFETIAICYDRVPWQVRLNGVDFRLTLDNQVFFVNGIQKHRLIPEEVMILEVKGGEDIESVVNYFFKMYGIFPEKVSKYKLGRRQAFSLEMDIVQNSLSR